jgi:hypothetical protein
MPKSDISTSSSDDDDDLSDMSDDEQTSPSSFAFTISENIGDDEDDINENEGDNEDDDETKQANSDDEADELIIKALTPQKLSDEPPPKRQKLDLSDMKEPVIVKPFDYEQLREEQAHRGVIFLQRPQAVDLQKKFGSKFGLNRFFSSFGTVTRVAPEFEYRHSRRNLIGFYIEFDEKEIAKRVALTLNGAPISRTDSRTLSVKYISKFNWSAIGENEERKKMMTKMLQMEAEKELRIVKSYKRNAKMPEKNRQKLKSVTYKQNKFHKYKHDKSHHLNFFPIFKDQNSSDDKK